MIDKRVQTMFFVTLWLTLGVCIANLYLLNDINNKMISKDEAIVINQTPIPKPKIKVPKPTFAKDDIYNSELESQKCLHEALYFESGNQDIQGKMAVAQVIRQREHSPFYSDSICGVVKSKSQFTYFWDGKTETPNLSNKFEVKAWNNARRVAEMYITEDYNIDRELITATMYHADYVKPKWDWSKVKFLKKVGSHLFYEEIRNLKPDYLVDTPEFLITQL